MIRGALFNRCLATSPPGLRRFAHRHRRRVSTVTSDPNNYDHFFRYTSGRWLWDEEQQLKDRFTPFNVRELKRIAAQSVGANECVDMTKLAEGSFNKIFRLSMDNGRAAIVRVPHPIAGPKYLTTASEVATMDFARNVLQIPVPRVYSWNAQPDNPVGAEYIVMEEAPGTMLDSIWVELPLEERINIMKDLISIEKKLLSVSFSNYGNLYYSNDHISGAVAAEVITEVSPEVKSDVKQRFCIGPVVDRDFWSKERATMNIDRGPWKQAQDYALAVAHHEIVWIKRYAVPKLADDPLIESAAQNSPSAHISLLQKYLQVAPYLLPADPEVVAPTIWHTDLHAGNIFVDNGRITSVIDWQGAWAAPLLLKALHSRLVDYDGEMILKPPANYKELDPEKKADLKKQMANSILLHLYELGTAKRNPRLNKVLRFELGRIRCYPMMFASDTWEDDIIPLRESLIKLKKHWPELGYDFPCPIHFTDEELQEHWRDADGWNEMQDFWKMAEAIVTPDGQTTPELYDTAIALFTEFREAALKTITTDEERRKFQAQMRWIEEIASQGRKGD